MGFIDVPTVQAQLDFELGEQGEAEAEYRIEMASEEARFYGMNWPDDACPKLVKHIVLNRVVRYMRNVEGYDESRAGDEMVRLAQIKKEDGSWYFTDEEKAILRTLGKPRIGLGSVVINPWGTRYVNPTVFVPVFSYPSADPFPLFASTDPILGESE